MAAVALPLLLASCDFEGELFFFPELEEGFGFEAGMGEWVGRTLGLGDPPTGFTVAPSTEQAFEGSRSLLLALDSPGEGIVWIERAFELTAGEPYEIRLSYRLATADAATVTPWQLRVGARPEPPRAATALPHLGETSSGSATGSEHVWTQRVHTLVSEASDEGEVWVFIGVAATSPGERRYFVDDVEVTFRRLPSSG